MELIHDFRPFSEGLHQLSVITTDLTEAEGLIKALAEEEKRRTPQAFAGKEACVYFKLPYVPPCDTFQELRRLILRIHESTGLRANFKGVVAIEAGEWIGHEREAYFTVLLKYLYDHRSLWKPALILNHCTPAHVNRFLSHCARYITPRLFPADLFSAPETLCRLIQQAFHRQGRKITQEAAARLAEAMARPELQDARSLALIDRIVAELISGMDTPGAVTADNVRGYLLEPHSTLTMMAGKPLFDERSMLHEQEVLQLRI